MVVFLEVLHNLAMGVPLVANWAQRWHTTGINTDAAMARTVFETYTRYAPVRDKAILEIGPGQTLEVLRQACAQGAKQCSAVDIVAYLSPLQSGHSSIRYVVYDGKTLPFESQSFDLVWSHTAFEHLRYPEITIQECFRVLRQGGHLVSLIDLQDHAFSRRLDQYPDRVFDCLRYPEWLWNLMKWNRSSYVNRLRKSEWLDLFVRAGFRLITMETQTNDHIARLGSRLSYLRKYAYDDAVTSVLTVCLQKPAAPER